MSVTKGLELTIAYFVTSDIKWFLFPHSTFWLNVGYTFTCQPKQHNALKGYRNLKLVISNQFHYYKAKQKYRQESDSAKGVFMGKIASNNKRSPLSKPVRYAGQSSEEKIVELQRDVFVYILITSFIIVLAIYEWWHWYKNIPPQPIAAFVLATIVGVYSYLKIRKIKKQINNYKLGRQGEIEVEKEWDKLKERGFKVFPDIICKDFDKVFNIDHVVVSRHGIFSIETKAYSMPAIGETKILFDGKNILIPGQQPDDKPVNQAYANAKWLSQRLEAVTGKRFAIMPVLVFLRWYVVETKKTKDIWVINPKMLLKRILQRPVSLSLEDVALIADRLSFGL